MSSARARRLSVSGGRAHTGQRHLQRCVAAITTLLFSPYACVADGVALLTATIRGILRLQRPMPPLPSADGRPRTADMPIYPPKVRASSIPAASLHCNPLGIDVVLLYLCM